MQENLIKSVWIDEKTDEPTPWIIDGLVCPWLTLLSGQPKHGKTTLAGHVVNSLLNGTPLFNKEVKQGAHKVAWMGYDGGWKEELRERLETSANRNIILYDPIRSLDDSMWWQLALDMQEKGITLFVLDHLYGMAGNLGLNDANNFALLANLLRPIYEDFGIAVLVLAQAGKGEFSRGRAAHSVALEGEARCLLRLYQKGANGARRLDISSNSRGDESLRIVLTPFEVGSKEIQIKEQDKATERNSPDLVRKLLRECNPEEMNNWSSVGRELHRLGFSTNAKAGRSMAKRFGIQGLLKSQGKKIVAGDSLVIREVA